jgi:hypothetical protein
MKLKKCIYYITKFTLIDQILGFMYWIFAIYGIFFLIEHISNKVLIAVTLCVYFISVILFYGFLYEKIYTFLRGDSEKKGPTINDHRAP